MTQVSIKNDPIKKRIHNIWSSMIERCRNKNAISYKYYGAVGISVCDEWKDFNNFYNWSINNGYNSNLTIDRRDGDGNYTPENCRWVDKYTQACNRKDISKRPRSVIQLSLNGDFIAEHVSVRSAQRSINASSHKDIVKCCQHHFSQAYGYKWLYADEYNKQEEKAK